MTAFSASSQTVALNATITSAGGTVNGAIDAAAARKRRIGRIDDGVDRERGDIGDADFKPRRSDLGTQQRNRNHHAVSLARHQAD